MPRRLALRLQAALEGPLAGGPGPDEVTLVTVIKGFPPEAVRQAAAPAKGGKVLLILGSRP